jgi:hypothetical protein
MKQVEVQIMGQARYETLTASNQKSYLLEACIRFKKTIIFSFHGTTRQLI